MSCPNSDKNFDKVLQKYFHSSSVNTRRNLYHFVCIPTRSLIILLAFYLARHDPKLLKYIMILSSLLSIYQLFSHISELSQWWSKKFQLIMAILLFVFSLVDVEKTPYILLISLLGGVMQHILNPMC